MNKIADVLGRLLGSILLVELQNRLMLKIILKRLNDGKYDFRHVQKTSKEEYASIAERIDKDFVWMTEMDKVKS